MATTSPLFALPAPQLGDTANIETAIVPLRDRIEVLLSGLAAVEIGCGIDYFGTTLPDPVGDVTYAWADGSLISRVTNATLFTRVGHLYNGGVDPGSSLMRLPDRRGRHAMGADTMGGSLSGGRVPNSNRSIGQNGGVERHALTVDQMPSHNHTVLIGDPNVRTDLSQQYVGSSSGFQGYGNAVSNSIGNTGGGTGHNNLSPYEVCNHIVRIR